MEFVAYRVTGASTRWKAGRRLSGVSGGLSRESGAGAIDGGSPVNTLYLMFPLFRASPQIRWNKTLILPPKAQCRDKATKLCG